MVEGLKHNLQLRKQQKNLQVKKNYLYKQNHLSLIIFGALSYCENGSDSVGFLHSMATI